jgi:hypothetical protein
MKKDSQLKLRGEKVGYQPTARSTRHSAYTFAEKNNIVQVFQQRI